MTPLSHLIAAAVSFVLSALLEIAEQRSRAWYQDRAMLRASGFFLGVGLMFVGLALL